MRKTRQHRPKVDTLESLMAKDRAELDRRQASARQQLAVHGIVPIDGEDPQVTLFKYLSSLGAFVATVQKIWRKIEDPTVTPEVATELAILGATSVESYSPELAARLLRRALERAPNRSAERMLEELSRRAPSAPRKVGALSARCADGPPER